MHGTHLMRGGLFVPCFQHETFLDPGRDQGGWISRNDDTVFIQPPVVRRDNFMADGVHVPHAFSLRGVIIERRPPGKRMTSKTKDEA